MLRMASEIATPIPGGEVYRSDGIRQKGSKPIKESPIDGDVWTASRRRAAVSRATTRHSCSPASVMPKGTRQHYTGHTYGSSEKAIADVQIETGCSADVTMGRWIHMMSADAYPGWQARILDFTGLASGVSVPARGCSGRG